MTRFNRGQNRDPELWVEKTLGRPGFVYVLSNDSFKESFLKIGSTTRRVEDRIHELNDEVVTAIPGCFKCLFKLEAIDCGAVEFRAHGKLAVFRRGKHGIDRAGKAWGQEFFEVPLDRAIQAIEDACVEVQLEHRERSIRELEESRRRDEEEARASQQRQAVADLPEEDRRSSYVFSWDKPRAGPSIGTVLCVIAGLVIGVVFFASRKTVPPPRPEQRAVQSAARPAVVSVAPASPADGYGRGQSSVGGPMLVSPEMPTSPGKVVAFPPGGSAMYFAGKAEGVTQASSVRLYVPATAQGRYAVLVIRMPQNEVYAQAYMEPNDLTEIAMPSGRFRLAYAKGFEWFGTRLMFGASSVVKQYGNEFDVVKGYPAIEVELPMD